MTANDVFQQEQVVRTYTVWTFRETDLTPDTSQKGFYTLPEDVEIALEEQGIKVSVHERNWWHFNEDSKSFENKGIVIEATLSSDADYYGSNDSITLTDGEKVVILGYKHIVRLDALK